MVLTAVTTKITFFWDVILCKLADSNILEELAATVYPEDGGSRSL
jgi:hypothetical protein